MRITVICPAQHRDDANHLAMALGESAADGLTYDEPSWQDASGNLYSVASLPVSSSFIDRATSALTRPEWDSEPYTISMAAAQRAQALVQLWQATEDDEQALVQLWQIVEDDDQPPQADPNAILAMAGDDPLGLLTAAGLTKATQESSNDSRADA